MQQVVLAGLIAGALAVGQSPAASAQATSGQATTGQTSTSDWVEITQRGESTWYEGLQLLAIYAVLGLTFFFV